MSPEIIITRKSMRIDSLYLFLIKNKKSITTPLSSQMNPPKSLFTVSAVPTPRAGLGRPAGKHLLWNTGTKLKTPLVFLSMEVVLNDPGPKSKRILEAP